MNLNSNFLEKEPKGEEKGLNSFGVFKNELTSNYKNILHDYVLNDNVKSERCILNFGRLVPSLNEKTMGRKILLLDRLSVQLDDQVQRMHCYSAFIEFNQHVSPISIMFTTMLDYESYFKFCECLVPYTQEFSLPIFGFRDDLFLSALRGCLGADKTVCYKVSMFHYLEDCIDKINEISDYSTQTTCVNLNIYDVTPESYPAKQELRKNILQKLAELYSCQDIGQFTQKLSDFTDKSINNTDEEDEPWVKEFKRDFSNRWSKNSLQWALCNRYQKEEGNLMNKTGYQGISTMRSNVDYFQTQKFTIQSFQNVSDEYIKALINIATVLQAQFDPTKENSGLRTRSSSSEDKLEEIKASKEEPAEPGGLGNKLKSTSDGRNTKQNKRRQEQQLGRSSFQIQSTEGELVCIRCGSAKTNISCSTRSCQSCCADLPEPCRVTAHAELKLRKFPSPHVPILDEAMKDQKWVEMVYGGENKTIKVKPKRWTTGKFMFLACLSDTKKERDKKLRMDRVHQVKLLP